MEVVLTGHSAFMLSKEVFDRVTDKDELS